MPASRAAEVLPPRRRPSISTVPSSAVSAPEMILMRVDLPAPFSPTSACTSPERTSKSTPRSAWTPPSPLRMPVRRNSPSGSVTAFPAFACPEARGHRMGPAAAGVGGRSVVELVDNVLGDPQRRAEQDHLLVREVLHRGQLVVDLVLGLQLLVVVQLLGRPGGGGAELLDVPG